MTDGNDQRASPSCCATPASPISSAFLIHAASSKSLRQSIRSRPFRNTAFFTKMYGDCKKGEVARRLARVVWLPKTWGKAIQFTSVNGADAQLRAVAAELDALPAAIRQAAYPIAGTYNCRAVADTGEPSPHSYGIAIDLNLKFSDYWFWRPHTGKIAYHNRMPEGDCCDLREARLHLGRQAVSTTTLNADILSIGRSCWLRVSEGRGSSPSATTSAHIRPMS